MNPRGLVLLTEWYQLEIVSSVARLIDWIVVSATKPMRHSTGLSASVQFSAKSAADLPKFDFELTIVAE